MIKLFLKTALRRLWKDQFLSATHLFGLAVGLATLFLIGRYVGFFHSRDYFQERKDRIYAIHQTVSSDQVSSDPSKNTYKGVAHLFQNEFADIVASTRYLKAGERLFVRKQGGGMVKSNEEWVVEVDPDFLKIFSIDLISGDPKTALVNPRSMLLSRSLAKKYFENAEAVGQTITVKHRWGASQEWLVTGVFEDYPDQSILKFSALQSLVKQPSDAVPQDWTSPFFKSYVLLREGVSSKPLAAAMSHLLNGMEPFQETGREIQIDLVPFDDLLALSPGQNILLLIGILLMLITWINHTNLSLARLLQHNKEFGIRKALGSRNFHLITHSLLEAGVIYFLGLLCAMLLVVGAYPYLSQMTDGQMLPLMDFSTPFGNWINLFVLVGSLFFTVVPILLVAGLSTVNLLNGKVHDQLKVGRFREVLMVFQLLASIVLMISMLMVYEQMRYVQTEDMGVSTDRVIVVKSPKDGWQGKKQRLKNIKAQLRNLPYSEHVTSSTTVPLWWPGGNVDFETDNQEETIRVRMVGIDEHYLACYGIQLAVGQTFQKGRGAWNEHGLVINESACQLMGFLSPAEALNQKVFDRGDKREFEIIGVIQDYHHESFRREIKPQVFNYNPSVGSISIRLRESQTSYKDLTRAVAEIEAIWNEIYVDQAFDYYFMDDRMDQLYRTEKVFETIYVAITCITLTITFLGIFALSLFISLARRKEIGVRKSLGARLVHILRLFTRQFEAKLLAAILLGAPIAYYLMELWLSNFHYRLDISWWYFLVASVALVAFVLASLSFEVVSMSRQSPVKMLREE